MRAANLEFGQVDPDTTDASQHGNLMDHRDLCIPQKSALPITLFPAVRLLGKTKVGVEWRLAHWVQGATTHAETGGHIRSRAGIVAPEIQYHSPPLAISDHGTTLALRQGCQVHGGTKRPKSRGWVRLSDASPDSLPRLRFNDTSLADDWPERRACILHMRQIFAHAALAPFRGREMAPVLA